MMRRREIFAICAALIAVALGTSSCGSSLTLAFNTDSNRVAAAYVDDIYGIHDRPALREAERLAAEKEAREKEEREKRIAAMVAATQAGTEIDDILDLSEEGIAAAGGTITTDEAGNVTINYNNIYVDDYASAYARRLQGFTSLTYRMPSSYWDFRYSDAYFLTLAYDPAFYTVMVMGDQVWVEPRYITNMFGSWNNPYYYGYRYGYNPYYYGYSYGYWDYWGWNSPYWACDPFFHNPYYHPYYYGWYSPHHHHHPHYPSHRPAGPGDHKRPNVTHKPSYGTLAGGGSSMRSGGGVLSYNDRLGGRGGTEIVTNTKGTTSSSSVRPATRPATGSTISTIDRGTSLGKPATKGELSSTLSGTTITSRPTRGNTTSGVSNSSSRTSRSVGTAVRSSSSSPKKSSSSVVRSSSSSSRTSYSSSSSSTSRSSYSSGSSSTSRSSYSSGGGTSSRSNGSTSRSGSSSRSGR